MSSYKPTKDPHNSWEEPRVPTGWVEAVDGTGLTKFCEWRDIRWNWKKATGTAISALILVPSLATVQGSL